MVTLIARIAMVTSWIFFLSLFLILWIAPMVGYPEVIWEVLEINEDYAGPANWTLWLGIVLTLIAMGFLASAYWSIERILRKTAGQDFYHLAKHMKRLALGLGGFWFFYNIIIAVLPHLLTAHLTLTEDEASDLIWLPYDLDVIILILAIALFAVAKHLKRAGDVEAENQQFV